MRSGLSPNITEHAEYKPFRDVGLTLAKRRLGTYIYTSNIVYIAVISLLCDYFACVLLGIYVYIYVIYMFVFPGGSLNGSQRGLKPETLAVGLYYFKRVYMYGSYMT